MERDGFEQNTQQKYQLHVLNVSSPTSMHQHCLHAVRMSLPNLCQHATAKPYQNFSVLPLFLDHLLLGSVLDVSQLFFENVDSASGTNKPLLS
jgi:hypothetical protein